MRKCGSLEKEIMLEPHPGSVTEEDEECHGWTTSQDRKDTEEYREQRKMEKNGP